LSSPDRRLKFYIENGYQDENGSAVPTKINEITSERLRHWVFLQFDE